MAVDYKILGQQSPANTSNVDLFSVVSAHQYVVSTIAVCNYTTTAATCRIWARRAGGGTTASPGNTALVYDASIPANSTVSFTLGVTLNGTAGDILTVRDGTGNALTFTAFGSDTY